MLAKGVLVTRDHNRVTAVRISQFWGIDGRTNDDRGKELVTVKRKGMQEMELRWQTKWSSPLTWI